MQTSLYKWASLVAQLVKNLPAMPETPVQFLGQEDRWRRDQLPTPVFLGFPGAQTVKNPPVMQETWVQSLGWKDPLEKGMANPLQYSGLENSMGLQRLRHDFHFLCKHFVKLSSNFSDVLYSLTNYIIRRHQKF